MAARVRYTGVGIDLGTSRPTPAAVQKSVRAVLEQSSYRSHARALAEAVARYRSLDLVRSELEALTAG